MSKASNYLIAIDDGHAPHTAGKRTPYISALGRQIRENEFNEPVANHLEAILKQCGFRTLQTAAGDYDTPLTTRTNRANAAKADLLISIHFNAMGSSFAYSNARGFSVHIQPADKSWSGSGSLKFAKLAIEELAKGTAQVNRGIVGQNLHMTRASNMPAALIECGFMDDPNEALLMISKSFQQEVAGELARAVCRYFDVPYIGTVSEVTPASSSTVNNYLSEGDTGETVKQLQNDLNEAGFDLTVDGIFGEATKEAVLKFQLRAHLKRDGIVGDSTKAKLAQVISRNEPKKEVVEVAEEHKKDAQPTKSLAREWEIGKELKITDGSYPQKEATKEEVVAIVVRALNLSENVTEK